MNESTGHRRATTATEQEREAERPADHSIGTDDPTDAERRRTGGVGGPGRFERSLPMPADRHE